MAKKVVKKSLPKSHYDTLKNQWLKKHKEARKNLHKKHKSAFDWIFEKFPDRKKLASSAIGALMLGQVLPASATLGALSNLNLPNTEQQNPHETTQKLLDELNQIVPEQVRPLNSNEEQKISEVLTKSFEMDIKTDINGLRLNRTYGLIGAEQHLMRFPGDTMNGHLDPQVENNHFFYSSGMAPGRGAWGYFASSKEEFSDKDKEREKWYIAVQTFEALNYNERLNDYRGFFKYRKMLVVNTKSGQAIVTDIADAGPAVFTGKHLGGSPEVMYFLGLNQGPRKGPVLYFFIQDPDDKIPLGPIQPR